MGELATNGELRIFAESMKQMYEELLRAKFTNQEAMMIISTIISSKITGDINSKK